MKNFADFLKSLGMVRLAALAVVTVGLLAFFAFISLRMNAEPKALLFSDIAVDDAARMIAELDAAKVQYELRGNGSMIYVPQADVLRLRMQMASKGLPAGGTVGYEIFDNADALGTTSFLQNINHLRALEGELARTIRAIDGIQNARVHLVLPERELFSRDRREPTASIVLKVARNTLATQQVKAIQYLVASAVDGLSPNRVSIVDERGTLLASGTGEDNQALFTSSVDERRTGYETRLRTHIENIVQRVVGTDKARVEVTAQMDYNRVTQTSDTFDPNSQVARSTQTVEDNSTSADGVRNDGVTVGNNLPNANLAAEGASGTSSQQTATRSEETVNYEISRTTKTEVLEPGRVRRVSVAVLVDGTYTTDAEGNTVYAPRNNEELAKIEALVKSAMGFDITRGDQVEIVNLRFAEPVVAETSAFADDATESASLNRADIMRLVEMAVLGVLALIAMIFILRPLLSRFLPNGAAAPTQQPALADNSFHPQGVLVGPDGASMPAGALPAPDLNEEMLIDIAQVAGKVKQSSMRKIGELVSNHPDESISILRSWLHETA